MDPQREAATLLAPEHRAAALALAEKSLVLVKNERSTLPFSSDVRRIAVIGPRADARADMMGPWSADGHPAEAVTLADGLRELLPQAEVVIDAGREHGRGPAADIAQAIAAAKAADVVVLALGEKAVQSGEAGEPCRSRPARRSAGAGTGGAGRRPADRRGAVPRSATGAGATGGPGGRVLLAWFPGTMGGAAIARTLFGANEPRGRLPISWPRSVGPDPGLPRSSADRPAGDRAARPYTTGYLDQSASPLFPFGFGLSYTSFTFAPPRLDRAMHPCGGQGRGVGGGHQHRVSGRGTALVELYVHQPVAEISRPVLEFRGFQALALEPGATGTARIELGDDELAYWHPERRPQGRSRPLRRPDRTGCRLVAIREPGAPAIARRLAVIGCSRR